MFKLPPFCCTGCQHLKFSVDPVLADLSYIGCAINLITPKKKECKRQKKLGERRTVWIINEGLA